MPNLKRFIEQGTAGVLHSTQPPITPAAWTTFMTGKGPGQHGILDFEKYDVFQHQLTFNSTYQIEEKTIWELLSEKGLRVGSINVPMTFPPKPINGFMISGFETPSIDAEFTYPRELKQEIFQQIPNYNYRTNWQRRALGGQDVLETNLEYIANSFEQGYRLTTYCGDKYGWDVLMTVMKLVDNLQHKAWKYLDPANRRQLPARGRAGRPRFSRAWTTCSAACSSMPSGTTRRLLIMSDHGHGSLDARPSRTCC
jgi:predicted AlkP superfamily phosphohydrolase/phosphomutase